MHFLGGVQLVAVNDGIHDGLFSGQMNAKDIRRRPAVDAELLQQIVHHYPAGATLAGQIDLPLPRPKFVTGTFFGGVIEGTVVIHMALTVCRLVVALLSP